MYTQTAQKDEGTVVLFGKRENPGMTTFMQKKEIRRLVSTSR